MTVVAQKGSFFRRNSLAISQSLLAIVLVAGLQLVPPDRGSMVYVPLTHDAADRLSSVALRKDARLLAKGTTFATITISGERPNLWHSLIQDGVLVISANPRLCSA